MGPHQQPTREEAKDWRGEGPRYQPGLVEENTRGEGPLDQPGRSTLTLTVPWPVMPCSSSSPPEGVTRGEGLRYQPGLAEKVTRGEGPLHQPGLEAPNHKKVSLNAKKRFATSPLKNGLTLSRFAESNSASRAFAPWAERVPRERLS